MTHDNLLQSTERPPPGGLGCADLARAAGRPARRMAIPRSLV